MIKVIKDFRTMAELESFWNDYLSSYPYQGYGTTSVIRMLEKPDEWKKGKMCYELTIERWESCD